MRVAGLLLAAGRGARMGIPKALVRDEDDRPWLETSRAVLLDAGCSDVLVVLGARAEEAAALVPGAWYTVAEDWADGMSASLRAGLTLLVDQDHDAALIHLVDLPDVDAEVAARVLRHADRDALARATYDGEPGHPVLIGRHRWADVLAGLAGDSGASGYLRQHRPLLVECGDLATGCDVDAPEGI